MLADAPPRAPGLHVLTDAGLLLELLRGLDASRIAVPEPVAAELCGLSAKTLQRASRSGEPTGRRRCGERVIYYLPELREWIASRPTG